MRKAKYYLFSGPNRQIFFSEFIFTLFKLFIANSTFFQLVLWVKIAPMSTSSISLSVFGLLHQSFHCPSGLPYFRPNSLYNFSKTFIFNYLLIFIYLFPFPKTTLFPRLLNNNKPALSGLFSKLLRPRADKSIIVLCRPGPIYLLNGRFCSQ